MTKDEKRTQALSQLDAMLDGMRIELIKKLDKALLSGAGPDEFFEDNALLAKCVMDSEMMDRQYGPPRNTRWVKEFKNIHLHI